MRRLPALLLGLVFLSCTTSAQDVGGRHMGRLAPPPAITCDRNQLTSWTGEVTGYRRQENQTWLEISTDEDTVEHTTIDHAGQPDASARYLLWGEAFLEPNWSDIEQSSGKLIDGIRATAWICLDGATAPIVDWQPRQD
ncbi:hypothetical protein ACFL1C_10990 [Pseudomonadota bacterium]